MKVLAGVFAAAIIGAIAFAYFEPVQVLPRMRLAPGYALVDHNEDVYTSESARGKITLYTFAPAGAAAAGKCEHCDRLNQTMADVAALAADNPAVDNIDLRFVTVALDSPDAAELELAATASGADGEQWRWLAGDETRTRNVVGAGFERYYEIVDAGDGPETVKFDPAFVLVDGNGVVRGEYGYQTLADDAEKIASHLEILADEIRYAHGPAAVAYEAAHLFLCYP